MSSKAFPTMEAAWGRDSFSPHPDSSSMSRELESREPMQSLQGLSGIIPGSGVAVASWGYLLVLAVLGLHCCAWAFLVAASDGDAGSAQASHCDCFSCCTKHGLYKPEIPVALGEEH